MKTVKLRLLLMGGVISTMGAVLLVSRGFSAPLAGLLVIGFSRLW